MGAALQLSVADRCRVAANLWESMGPPSMSAGDGELDQMLNQRENEMDQDSSVEISHEEFLGHFANRRRG
jgi:hypothetical protein